MVSTIALVGGESSGKTTLARELGEYLAQTCPVATVSEVLRQFVAEHRRPPFQTEQAAILEQQIAAERQAAAGLREPPEGFVIVDPSPLMTAVYSVLYFDDDSLVERAVEHCRSYDLHVWCRGDFPWQADPGVRDGEQYRTRAAQIIAEIAAAQGLELLVVAGSVAQRVQTIELALASS